MSRPFGPIAVALTAHVAANPGVDHRAIFASIGTTKKAGHSALARALRAGHVHRVGGLRTRQYFATAELAGAYVAVQADPVRRVPYVRPSPVLHVILTALHGNPGGLTGPQVAAITGQRENLVATALHTATRRGLTFAIMRAPWSLFFGSAEDLEAARPAVTEMHAELARQSAARRVLMHKTAQRARLSAQRAAEPPRVAKAPKPAKPMAVALAKPAPSLTPKKWPKAEPIKPATRVRTGPRTGWGPDDPMHETPATIYTRYPTQPMGLRTNTHSQF